MNMPARVVSFSIGSSESEINRTIEDWEEQGWSVREALYERECYLWLVFEKTKNTKAKVKMLGRNASDREINSEIERQEKEGWYLFGTPCQFQEESLYNYTWLTFTKPLDEVYDDE